MPAVHKLDPARRTDAPVCTRASARFLNAVDQNEERLKDRGRLARMHYYLKPAGVLDHAQTIVSVTPSLADGTVHQPKPSPAYSGANSASAAVTIASVPVVIAASGSIRKNGEWCEGALSITSAAVPPTEK